MYPIIGRSERDDIISNGVCLSRDLEVSSFHGKVGLTGIIDCVVLSARRPAEVQRYEQYKPQLCQRVSVMNRELVEDYITLKTGDVLHVGQSELKISIQKV